MRASYLLISASYAIAACSPGHSPAALGEQRSYALSAQSTRLDPGPRPSRTHFGSAVDIDGAVAVVGASSFDGAGGVDSGAVFVYRRGDSGWALEASLEAADGDIADEFGTSVAVSGDVIAVGAPKANLPATDAGAVYIFVHDPRDGSWTESAKLTAADSAQDDNFGAQVALDGELVAVGAQLHDGVLPNTGAIYLFRKGADSETWEQEAQLEAADPSENDILGHSLTLEGDQLASGILDDEGGTDAGTVLLFVRDPATGAWTLDSQIRAERPGPRELFGGAVSLSGDRMLIGAGDTGVLGVSQVGTAYVYQRGDTGWVRESELRLLGDDLDPALHYGSSVALHGDLAVVGAWKDDERGNDAGAAFVYERGLGGWELSLKLTPASLGAGDHFGRGMAIDGNTLIIGAPGADGVASDEGDAYLLELATTNEPPACDRDRDCEDGQVCNGRESCEAGSCGPGPEANCDDRNVCTADACSEPDGCTHEPIAECCVRDRDCDDGDPCTEDSCDQGAERCVYRPIGSLSCAPPQTDAGSDVGSDAGTADAAADADGERKKTGAGGCSLSANAPSRPGPGSWKLLGLGVGLGALALGRRRRRA